MKLLAAFLLCLPAAVLAQLPAKRDSLLRLAQTAQTDTARVWALMEAGKLFLNARPDTAAYYIGEALALAEKTSFERGIAKCCINKSSACNNLGRFQESVPLCRRAAEICARLGMKKELVAAWNNLGNAYDYTGARYQAIEAFSKALKAMEGVALPPHFPITVRNNIGRQYNDLRLYDKAFEYGKKSLDESRMLGDSVLVAYSLQIMAIATANTNREVETLDYCRRIARIARADDVPTLLIVALNNIAAITAENDPVAAQKLYREALAKSVETGDLFGEISQLQGLSRLAFRNKTYAQARAYATDALEKAKKEKIDDEVCNLYLILSDIALAEGKMPEHLEYRNRHIEMRDTLASKALVSATEELEIQYETEKKERQIEQLEQAAELQKLRIRQKNSLLGGLGALSGLLALAGFLSIRNLRHRRRLAEQEIKIQQQQITQLRQEQQLHVADAVLRSQEDERSRLARDLHDGLGGMLSGVKQSLNGMQGHQILPSGAAEALTQVISDLDRSIGELRHIARNMMPEALLRFGLDDALRDYCDHLQNTTGLAVQYQSFGLKERLPQQTEVTLFRIAQELLSNILKHAFATAVLVQLMHNDGRVSMTVEDNGRGFDPEKLKAAPGVGWLNIQSRVQYLNGTLDLHTRPGAGTSVNIEFGGLT